MNQDQVRSIAEQVRFWAEGRAEGTYKEGNLNGMCAVAAAELWRQLAANGIKSEICAWICPADQETAHVFLLVDDEYILDVTCTQFSKMSHILVYFEHHRVAEQWDWYQIQFNFATPDELIRWQKKTRWPVDQIAWSK